MKALSFYHVPDAEKERMQLISGKTGGDVFGARSRSGNIKWHK